MASEKEKYVIVGFGWVGQANAIALRQSGYDVAYFDPVSPLRHYDFFAPVYDSLEKISDIRSKDSADTWYVVCVGDRVSEEGVQDISNIKNALDSLEGVKGGIILRSTILPEHLEDLRFDYYLPEFLHEKKAVEECIDPYLFVVGSRGDAREEPSVFALWRKSARKSFKGTPEEASFIKYFSNLWNATRIAFVNEFGDAIGRPKDKEHLHKIEKVVDFLFDGKNYSRYGRSFGGHCLPKDTRAFLGAYNQGENRTPLLFGVYESNRIHEKLEERFPLMPEWYSEWPDRHISGWHAFQELLFAIRKHLLYPVRAWGMRTQKK